MNSSKLVNKAIFKIIFEMLQDLFFNYDTLRM